jgi:hypothetical protein
MAIICYKCKFRASDKDEYREHMRTIHPEFYLGGPLFSDEPASCDSPDFSDSSDYSGGGGDFGGGGASGDY